MARPRILCISLSPIERDSRVLRQISVLAEFGDVTTIGYGRIPEGAVEHIQVPDSLPSLPQTVSGVARLGLRMHRSAELAAPAVRFASVALRSRRFDLIVANEARVLALADEVAHGAPVWADMHEWAPEERTHILSWRLLVAPFMTHLCARYLPGVEAVTTVGRSIANLYRAEFGVAAEVMRNAPKYQQLAPSSGGEGEGVVRLVHSGAAVHGRELESMIDAVLELGERFTLDLYLVPAADGGRYLAELRRRTQGSDRIRFHDPVLPHELPEALNQYDVGVYWMPPVHTNARLALPNKFFDFIQARLAIAIGPSVEMEHEVRDRGLGIVITRFAPDSYVESLRGVTAAEIREWKRAADTAARDLSFESEAEVARGILSRLLTKPEHPA